VLLSGTTRVKPGDIVAARVRAAGEYDLWADLEDQAGRSRTALH